MVARLLPLAGVLLAAGPAAAAPLLGDGDPLLGGGSNRMIFNAPLSPWGPLPILAPLTRPGLIPGDMVCEDGTPATPVLRCGVPFGEDRWACVDEEWNEIPVVQGTGTVYEEGPWGRAMRPDTTAAVPRIAAATAAAAGLDYIWTGDYTAIFAASVTNAAFTHPRVYGHGALGNSGTWAEFFSGYFSCAENHTNNLITNTISVAPLAQLSVGACRKSGTTLTTWLNGSAASKDTGGAVPPPTGHPFYFGGYATTATAGPVAHVLVYGCALSDSSLTRFAASVHGVRAGDGRPVTTTRAGPAWCDGGWVVGSNVPCASERGLESYGAVLNYWTNSTDPEAWLEHWGGSASGSVITDSHAAQFAGRRVVLNNPGTGGFYARCLAKAGSLSKARIRYIVNGGATYYCDQETLAPYDGPARWMVGCPVNVTSGSELHVAVELGEAASDTGTIVVETCQLEKSPTPGRRCDAGASPTTCPGDVHTVSTAGWPVSSGWLEFSYTPAYANSTVGRYLLDSRVDSSTSGVGFSVRIQPSNALTHYSYGGVAINSAGLTWEPGTTYRIRVEWRGAAVRLFRGVAGASVELVAAGTSIPITGHAPTAKIGGSHPMADGTIADLRMGRL